MAGLFDPFQLGAIALTSRIVMAPMTRSRATAIGDLPTGLHLDYYAQRAVAGLIVTEGVQPSPDGKGYCRTPGIYDAAQVEAWSRVTGAVHAAGGRIVLQIMHVGRIASWRNKATGAETIAPSAIRAAGRMFTDDAGPVEHDTPRALETHEIAGVIAQYATAAVNARAAGFDGVEIHGASGYLPMQFLTVGANRRSDRYGGTLARRLRFTVEAAEAVAGAIGADRTGLRICPANPYNDSLDDDPAATYTALLDAIGPLGLAYLHVVRSPDPTLDAFALARRGFTGPLILNDGFDFATGEQAIAGGDGDLVSYGRHFIANPDLVDRFRRGLPLSAFDRRTLYTPGAAGYTDYPAAGATLAAS